MSLFNKFGDLEFKIWMYQDDHFASFGDSKINIRKYRDLDENSRQVPGLLVQFTLSKSKKSQPLNLKIHTRLIFWDNYKVYIYGHQR
jgi:hypothetical protein